MYSPTLLTANPTADYTVTVSFKDSDTLLLAFLSCVLARLMCTRT
jgi:hypothetical protein